MGTVGSAVQTARSSLVRSPLCSFPQFRGSGDPGEIEKGRQGFVIDAQSHLGLHFPCRPSTLLLCMVPGGWDRWAANACQCLPLSLADDSRFGVLAWALPGRFPAGADPGFDSEIGGYGCDTIRGFELDEKEPWQTTHQLSRQDEVCSTHPTSVARGQAFT